MISRQSARRNAYLASSLAGLVRNSHTQSLAMLHIVAQVLRLQGCSELSLFQACMIWAEAPGRSMQEVEQLLPLIRYPFMTQQELQVGAALYCSAA